jgi:hypothetical protein
MHDLAFEMAQSDALLKIVTTTLQDWNSATELERARAASFVLGYFKLFENAWFQMVKGHSNGTSGKDTTHFCAPFGCNPQSRHGGP